MSCNIICITLACWNLTQPLTTTTRATSAAICAFVIFLLKQGYSVRDIEKRIKEVMNTDQEKIFGGCSSKLSAYDKTFTSH